MTHILINAVVKYFFLSFTLAAVYIFFDCVIGDQKLDKEYIAKNGKNVFGITAVFSAMFGGSYDIFFKR